MAKQKAFDVFVPTQSTKFNVVGLKLIDTVFYDSDFTADQVRRSLIGHDGYDSRIIVKEA